MITPSIIDRFGLSPSDRDIIQTIFDPLAPRLECVAVFGSRAQGRHRPNSDLDLVLYGKIESSDHDRLLTLFQDSSLPFSVDIIHYSTLNHPPLRAHIDAVARPLLIHRGQGLIYLPDSEVLISSK